MPKIEVGRGLGWIWENYYWEGIDRIFSLQVYEELINADKDEPKIRAASVVSRPVHCVYVCTRSRVRGMKLPSRRSVFQTK